MSKIIKEFIRLFDFITKIPTIIFGIIAFLTIFYSPGNVWVIILGVIMIIGSLITSACILINKYRKEKERIEWVPDENLIASQLKLALVKWYENEEYGEVVKFGRTIGRALYLSACYDTRIQIGEILKESAQHQEDIPLLISVLIDDLGWTKVLCKRKDAYVDIKNGLTLAEKENDYKSISKAYRHLLALEVSNWDNPDQAHEYLQKSYEACGKMPEGKEQEIVYAGLYYAEAELCFKEQEYNKAMEMAELSKERREFLKETDRRMRYYAQIGKIELFRPNGNIKTARDYFKRGIEESENANRIDEMVKNAYGYAYCCYKLREIKKIDKYAKGIIERYGQVPLYSEDELLRKKYIEEKNSSIKC